MQTNRIIAGVDSGYLLPSVADSDPSGISLGYTRPAKHPDRSVFVLLSFGSKNKIKYQVAISNEQLIHPYGLPYQWHNFLFADHYEVWPGPVESDRFRELIQKIESDRPYTPYNYRFLFAQMFFIKKEKLNAS